MEKQVETMKAPQPPSGTEMTKNWRGREGPCGTPLHGATLGPLTSSKSEGPGVIESFIGMGIEGFWFGIWFMLAVKTVNNLEELIRR